MRHSEFIKNYIQTCKNFANDTKNWYGLDEFKFYTTGGWGENGWSETSDNAHGGVDISWAFHRTDEEIEKYAAGELLNLLIEDIDGITGNFENQEDVRLIDTTLEQYRNI